MSHYNKTGEDPSRRPGDTIDENYASTSNYDDTGQQIKQKQPDSNYEDTSAGQIRLNLSSNQYPIKIVLILIKFAVTISIVKPNSNKKIKLVLFTEEQTWMIFMQTLHKVTPSNQGCLGKDKQLQEGKNLKGGWNKNITSKVPAQ